MAADHVGRARLEALGMRGVPVVARGSDAVYAQDLADVARVAGIAPEAAERLPGDVLLVRYERVLRAAQRFARQIPVARLGDKLPNRDRTYRALLNHLVEIAAGFVAITRGASFEGRIASATPDPERDVPELLAHADSVIADLQSWWLASVGADLDRAVPTYYGPQTLHAVLERCTWHSAQHLRQTMMVLGTLGIAPDGPLGASDFAGLPMPVEVWDG